MQPILHITVPIKKDQCYGGGDGVVRCEWTFKRLTVSDAASGLARNGQDPEGWAGHIPATRWTRGGHAEVKSHSQGHLQPHILDGASCRVPSSPQRLLCSISVCYLLSVLIHPVSVDWLRHNHLSVYFIQSATSVWTERAGGSSVSQGDDWSELVFCFIVALSFKVHSHLWFIRRELLRKLFSPLNREKWLHNPLLNFSV